MKISKDDSIILDGQGARAAIEDRCQLLRESIERTKSDYEKEKLQERLAKLHSGVAVIKVMITLMYSRVILLSLGLWLIVHVTTISSDICLVQSSRGRGML